MSHYANEHSLTMCDMTEYVDKLHVPVLMTGTWNASTGEEPITDDDLTSIVQAAESGVLDSAILKVGHVDPRFESYLEDGTPAYGTVSNPVIEALDDQSVLYVDYLRVEKEFADSLPTKYPRCSVELARNVTLRDQTGATVHEFPVVLTAVALLGATPPAVKGLSTKVAASAALAEDANDYVTLISFSQFSFPGGNTARSLNEKLAAAVDQAHSSESVWAYAEDFDDTHVIFTVENGSESVSYRQRYAATSDGNVELQDDPTRVVREVAWVTESGEKVAAKFSEIADETGENTTDTESSTDTARHDADVPPRDAQIDHSQMEADPADTENVPEGDEEMPTVDKDTAAELRRQHGLAENASYEDILAKVLEANDGTVRRESVAPGTDEQPNDERREQQQTETEQRLKPYMSEGGAEKTGEQTEQTGNKTGEQTEKTETSEADIAKLSQQLGGQFVSASAFAEFQARAEADRVELSAIKAERTKQRRDGLVVGWFSAGKLGRDEVKTVREQLDKPGAEEIVAELIDGRAPMFSTSETGHAKLDPAHLALDTASTLSEKQYEADDAVFGVSN